MSELETASQLDIDDATRVMLRGVIEYFRVLQGRSDPIELDGLLASLEALEDGDVAAGGYDLRGYAAFARGDWQGAHDSWLQAVGRSDLNEPYVLPRAAHAAVLAGDARAAALAMEQLDRIGTRGRAVDADRTAIKAGIAALEGDRSAALSGYRLAIAAWRDLGMPFDEAVGVLSAVTRLGAAVPADWIEVARAIFVRLEATPLLALLDAAVAAARPGSRDEPMAGSGARQASVEDAVRTT